MNTLDPARFLPAETASVLIDMQNDFLHPRGTHGRAGCAAPELAALTQRLATVARDVATVQPPHSRTFHQSRLDVLCKAGITTLVFGGIVTNAGVAWTLRYAHVLEFEAFLLSDGCAAFRREVHETTVAALGAVAPVTTCDVFTAAISGR